MKKIVVFSGAGLDRESGILTFRDCEDGLWNNYKIEDVASPQGWKRDRECVLDFYNERRKDIEHKVPNDAHKAIVELEKYYDVVNVTQNVSDMLEKAGATNIVHLHGELTKARPSEYSRDQKIIDIGYNDIKLGDKCENGSQLRPHIVFFTEPVPNMQEAFDYGLDCDIFIIIGTSLNVTPASELVDYAIKDGKEIYLIDPERPLMGEVMESKLTFIQKTASEGMKELLSKLQPNPRPRIERMSGGIKCDHCDWVDNDVDTSDYDEWLGRPCPECGANLLTEEDLNNVKTLHKTIDLINAMSDEEYNQHQISMEQVLGTDFLKDAEGLDSVDMDSSVSVTVDTHKGIKATKIEKYGDKNN